MCIAVPIAPNLNAQRFTLDGSDELEHRLANLCDKVRAAVCKTVPQHKLEGLILGGGYGRGQGGVLRTAEDERPYNDIEFYVFVAGNSLLNSMRHGADLEKAAEQLSETAGLHVEFKLDSLNKLRNGAVSMFSYDLVSRHRALVGNNVFAGCDHHRDARKIPHAEAIRLLLNRCTGLLLAKELLLKPELSTDDCEFIGRNLAKAGLAFGDAVLTAHGQYHWSCLERHQRLWRLTESAAPALAEVRKLHAEAVEFKLHPSRVVKSAAEFRAEHEGLTRLALELWLWLETRRLSTRFDTARSYALHDGWKLRGTNAWRNWLLNLTTFGPRAAFGRGAFRYPREHLLHALPLLLWNPDGTKEPGILRRLQRLLHADSTDWKGFVGAYKRLWARYG